MPDKLIYLDYAASTPVCSEAVAAMLPYLEESHGAYANPSSVSNQMGLEAQDAVSNARADIAAALRVQAQEVIFTSCASESINMALIGLALHKDNQKKHIITMQTEHQAVLATCDYLQSQGFKITKLKPMANGLLDLNELEDHICSDTLLVAVMMVNNETGVIQDIQKISQIAHAHQALMFCDMVQAVGKIPVDIPVLGVDLAAISAHKFYGPKGVGALVLCHNTAQRLRVGLFGGGHEMGLRSGTLAVHQIVAMAAAIKKATLEQAQDYAHIQKLESAFKKALMALSGGLVFAGNPNNKVPHILHFAIASVEGDQLFDFLSQYAAFSAGSACRSGNENPSHVLTAMGVEASIAQKSIRFSFGRYTRQEDIILLIGKLEAFIKTQQAT